MRKTEITKRTRPKGGQPDHPALQTGTKIESGSPPTACTGSNFGPYLLDISPAEKSGFLFSDRCFEKWDAKKNAETKRKYAIEWLKILKKHPDYQPIHIDKNDSIENALGLLHAETSRLFKDHVWTLYFPSWDSPTTLYYYKYIGSVYQLNIPLDLFSESEDKNLREAALMLINEIAKQFHVGLMENEIFNMVTDDVENPDTIDDFDDEKNFEEAMANLISYKKEGNGKPYKLMKEMARMKKFNVFQFKELVKNIKDKEIAKWLLSGLKVLETPVSIHDFNLNPYDLGHEDGDPVSIDYGIFFPYTFGDYAYDKYEEWLNSMNQSFGTSDIFEFGFINKERHVTPTDKKGLFKLMAFLNKGRDILKYNTRH